jgi:ribonuclease HI
MEKLCFLSAISAVKSERNTELSDLRSTVAQLAQDSESVVIQWIPSHCKLKGNEDADRLAKEGARMSQDDNLVS